MAKLDRQHAQVARRQKLRRQRPKNPQRNQHQQKRQSRHSIARSSRVCLPRCLSPAWARWRRAAALLVSHRLPQGSASSVPSASTSTRSLIPKALADPKTPSGRPFLRAAARRSAWISCFAPRRHRASVHQKNDGLTQKRLAPAPLSAGCRRTGFLPPGRCCVRMRSRADNLALWQKLAWLVDKSMPRRDARKKGQVEPDRLVHYEAKAAPVFGDKAAKPAAIASLRFCGACGFPLSRTLPLCRKPQAPNRCRSSSRPAPSSP